jgi:hypothetical protein
MGTGLNVGFMNWMGILDTGNGNDMIMGIGNLGLANEGVSFNTGGGNDTIIGNGIDLGIETGGVMDTGDGNDIIIGTNITADPDQKYLAGINNVEKIITGDGNDLIVGTGSIGIHNIGVINTGNGDDSLIANGGFESDSNMSGSVFLGNGKDYLKGFGNGNFNGGNGKDTLELTPGSYTIGISGTAVNFTKSNQLMITSEFEKLIAGSTTYDFTNLTAGQIIIAS